MRMPATTQLEHHQESLDDVVSVEVKKKLVIDRLRDSVCHFMDGISYKWNVLKLATALTTMFSVAYMATPIRADEVVEDPSALIMIITENDGQPDRNESKTLEEEELTWQYTVLNNSNLIPYMAPGWNKKIEQIKIEDVYSAQAPTVPELMDNWTAHVTADGENNWDILLDTWTSWYYIKPGHTKNFTIITTISDNASDVEIGNNLSQAYMITGYPNPTKDWLPSIGVPVIGPVGELSLEQSLENESINKGWNINITNPPEINLENSPVHVHIDIDGIYSIDGEYMGDKVLQILVGNHMITLPNYEANTTHGVLTAEEAFFSGIVNRFSGEEGSGMKANDPMYFVALTNDGLYIDDSANIAYPEQASTIQMSGLNLEPLGENPQGKYIFFPTIKIGAQNPGLGALIPDLIDLSAFTEYWRQLVADGAPDFLDVNRDGIIDFSDIMKFIGIGYLNGIDLGNINDPGL